MILYVGKDEEYPVYSAVSAGNRMGQHGAYRPITLSIVEYAEYRQAVQAFRDWQRRLSEVWL